MSQLNGIKLVLLLSLLVTSLATAHSGRTNAEGCHNNRKTGDYHCHGGKSQREDYFGQNEPAANKPAASQRKGIQPGTAKKSLPPKKTPQPRSDNPKTEDTSQSRAAAPPPDPRVQCVNSKNIDHYWEPVTRRCLEISTGKEITP
ncbi:DUF1283 domain-containing protein [Erwinia sp.]|uniref:DUF1283 domain-containing protein n=1 Tax=Erwinia citreus TaxID=558 RepID=UPI003C746959